jgi:hypothetical protein
MLENVMILVHTHAYSYTRTHTHTHTHTLISRRALYLLSVILQDLPTQAHRPRGKKVQDQKQWGG